MPVRSLTPLLVGALVLVGTTPAASQAPPADARKVALIRRVLEQTKSADVAATAIETAIPQQRAANPRIPKEFWDEFGARARRDLPSLIEQLIPIYDAHFTVPQLEQLIAFYDTPLGRHLIEVQPILAVQSMQAGSQWGEQLALNVVEDLRRRGIQMPPP